jgi:hypothetical protein
MKNMMLRNRIASTACACTLAALALVLASAGGCGPAKQEAAEATAQASGSVAVNGKAVREGTVGFFSLGSGASGQASLDKAGKFQLESPLPPGEYTVYLSGASNVPEKFQSETSSDYRVTLKEGANDLTIDLK